MATRAEYRARKGRESLGKRLGTKAVRIKMRDGHQCAYCHAHEIAEAMAGRSLHLDHLKTHDTGGKDVPKNLVTACHRCNSTRHDMTLEQWSKFAKTNLGLKFTAQSILDQAGQTLPPRPDRDTRSEQAGEMEAHRERAREHDAAARDAKTPEEKNAHEIASLVHNVAARAAKEGSLSDDHRRAAKEASSIANGTADRSAAARKAWETRRAS